MNCNVTLLLTLQFYCTVRYNGELIQQGLKAVPAAVRPAGYEYGNVNNDAIPVLATFLLLSVAIAALVRTVYVPVVTIVGL